MDAASAAAQSDPVLNPHFRRPWAEPPPQKRRRPGMAGTMLRAEFEGFTSTDVDSLAERAAQRAIAKMAARAAALDRTAGLMLCLGKSATACRLARRAGELRAVTL